MLCGDPRGERRQYSLNNKWVQEPSRGWTIYAKIMLGSGSELGGVRVLRAGPFFIHNLELRFKRQIFMIFIVHRLHL